MRRCRAMTPSSIAAAVKANIVLFGAFGANLGIAIAKFVAASMTGSSSMLSEGFHSLVDSANQILLFYGARKGTRPADTQHPFGYGREVYFWSVIVAILIFAFGAGISIYEGWLHVREPESLRDPTVNYIVLAFAMLLEGGSWGLAAREFARAKGDTRWWRAIRDSKDPATFVVLFEDSAALIGLVVAAIGVWSSHHWNDPRIDGVASIVIGLVLAGVAVLLLRESKGLLIGERASPAITEHVRGAVANYPGVVTVNHVRTIHTAPKAVFVALSVDFEDNLTRGQGMALIEMVEAGLKADLPELSSIYIRPERREDAVVVQPGSPHQRPS